MAENQSRGTSTVQKQASLWQWDTLWRHPDFMKFWVGQTISVWGDQLTMLALPLTAVLVLNVNAGQLGVLSFLQTLPFLGFPLVFGP